MKAACPVRVHPRLDRAWAKTARPHQSVEHVSSLRLIPNLDNWRPADTVESMVAWGESVKRADGPSTLIFSRQNLPFIERSAEVLANVAKGGYVLSDEAGAKAILIATGSEVELAMKAAAELKAAGTPVRVVSMPRRPTCSTARTQPTRHPC
ncbi:transketolase-like TK C-terminal-containing protein [Massilia eburnea]|uniref:transketolase-like TK C-terminal-containing protein n=1 Tax=Massilia eburnea TaxID=1776165 RepID=UPI003D6BA148